jgi:hypothetical protein
MVRVFILYSFFEKDEFCLLYNVIFFCLKRPIHYLLYRYGKCFPAFLGFEVKPGKTIAVSSRMQYDEINTTDN